VSERQSEDLELNKEQADKVKGGMVAEPGGGGGSGGFSSKKKKKKKQQKIGPYQGKH
jgi:hypothetical protein